MRLILLIAAVFNITAAQSQQSQTYYLKKTTTEVTDSNRTHLKPFIFTPSKGTVSFEKYTVNGRTKQKLMLHTEGLRPRVYELNFEPIETNEGLYFIATFEGRIFECWYDLNKWRNCLIIKRHRFLTYYVFKTERK